MSLSITFSKTQKNLNVFPPLYLQQDQLLSKKPQKVKLKLNQLLKK
jgi:hypothetical protein